MAKLPGLRPRKPSGIYYYRVRVPKNLVGRFGFEDLWVSLRTRDSEEAKELYWLEAAKWQSAFNEQHRRRDILQPKDDLATQTTPISKDEAIALARALIAQRLSLPEMDLTRQDIPEETADDLQAEIDTDLGELLERDNGNADLRVSRAATGLLQQHGYGDVATGSDPMLLKYVRRALIALAYEERARLAGDFSGNISDQVFQDIGPADLEVQRNEHAPLTVEEASVIFWRDRIVPDIKSVKTELRYKSALREVVDFLGPQTPISKTTRANCTEFRNVLAHVPPNHTKRFKNKTLREAADAAQQAGLAPLAFNTQLTYLRIMFRLLEWANDEGHLPDIKLNNIRPLAKKLRDKDKRPPFSAEQLTKIFNAPIYTGCVDDIHRFARPGPNIIRRSRYWVPLIALFTGMRMGEILQLTVDHVRVSYTGIDFFPLTPDLQLKNENSVREVPIHSLLIKMGFLDFVAHVRRSKRKLLFDDVPKGSDGYQSTLFSKRFAYFLGTVGLKDVDVESCFHMFRHTLTDALSLGHVPEEYISKITGWSTDGKMVRTYGSGAKAEELKPWIEQLILPRGFDCTHLLVKMPARKYFYEPPIMT